MPIVRACRVFTSLLLATAGSIARGDEPDSIMYREPQVPVARTVKTFPKGLTELWLAALDRPEREVRSQAALAIAAAHEAGMPGLGVATGPLTKLLDRPDEHPAVLTAAARALVALDARDAAPVLLRLARSGDLDLRELVEPALARWDYRPARDIWLDRLTHPPPHGRG